MIIWRSQKLFLTLPLDLRERLSNEHGLVDRCEYEGNVHWNLGIASCHPLIGKKSTSLLKSQLPKSPSLDPMANVGIFNNVPYYGLYVIENWTKEDIKLSANTAARSSFAFGINCFILYIYGTAYKGEWLKKASLFSVNVKIDKPEHYHREAASASTVADVHCMTCNCLLENWTSENIKLSVNTAVRLPQFNAASRRYHLYQLWKSYIRRPMILVGPSLGAAIAIDFTFNFLEAVRISFKLVLHQLSSYSCCMQCGSIVALIAVNSSLILKYNPTSQIYVVREVLVLAVVELPNSNSNRIENLKVIWAQYEVMWDPSNVSQEVIGKVSSD
ncbi:unnamed protein product [Ilex paraguariensis]|uniref:Uncharacterized protein n=1 Tax=Ilex paraguariensis TaxID=185542 RepID=A0ABC8RAL2_9AQUA